jgi:hypothetical protein
MLCCTLWFTLPWLLLRDCHGTACRGAMGRFWMGLLAVYMGGSAEGELCQWGCRSAARGLAVEMRTVDNGVCESCGGGSSMWRHRPGLSG